MYCGQEKWSFGSGGEGEAMSLDSLLNNGMSKKSETYENTLFGSSTGNFSVMNLELYSLE